MLPALFHALPTSKISRSLFTPPALLPLFTAADTMPAVVFSRAEARSSQSFPGITMIRM